MIYFTADHHFSHKNIIKYCGRPFQSAEEMNAVMIQRWNETVQPGDTVFYLGDFSLGIQSVLEILPILNDKSTLSWVTMTSATR
ncbi:MAG TPA: hypothetical protein DCS07_00820 [Bdellovibrionales bacterium]|nr:MAG: hypothetical protein A2Z97_04110 [Bdellovibrionales bacterium GWB1_52_6]OFZ02420.1 MAG: hypothetical protein A2X97_12785 [Bdellovibrionales bacterium GWA1_52_35]OFZ34350.1 MAG: hypothetical protein A2070_03020 [Bdellovibrionales bacterium GWC1_52_8]HAR41171.1 hypothetical protein [Bdellovibrionales bacterium]HCM41551.1 hypothetical protein [Bdellovibrionales bacterium]